jgi:hypothetical protein
MDVTCWLVTEVALNDHISAVTDSSICTVLC